MPQQHAPLWLCLEEHTRSAQSRREGMMGLWAGRGEPGSLSAIFTTQHGHSLLFSLPQGSQEPKLEHATSSLKATDNSALLPCRKPTKKEAELSLTVPPTLPLC